MFGRGQGKIFANILKSISIFHPVNFHPIRLSMNLRVNAYNISR